VQVKGGAPPVPGTNPDVVAGFGFDSRILQAPIFDLQFYKSFYSGKKAK
jgi:hypothetical protein